MTYEFGISVTGVWVENVGPHGPSIKLCKLAQFVLTALHGYRQGGWVAQTFVRYSIFVLKLEASETNITAMYNYYKEKFIYPF